MKEGQRIVAAKHIGGWSRPSIPRGSEGIIAKVGMLGDMTAVFLIKKWWTKDRLELVRIERDEVEPN
ncbi:MULTISPECIES: hypothetical protein [Paenarthrobacter]|uniref:hypothetical protein n=1 Tax=Paenarthrobacter TaxID=1742992 RepID=UPI0009AE7B6A|nr:MULTISPECIES: hypothetical protein [Paenarthrobacter]BCW12867.1 hypothetical protein NtRootA2_41490 [Arthrobacter sp. NtRootA2]BCW17249.1 hypothetical protein NtRootA4_42280 [Arthrobacter sp. NtRootA4]BCW25357.1 hypothetical protein NtRootC7_42240 [Arthrobacter sp. NtRootC7]BCW29560.1 hypothetical protein NtRootC45_41600 [Arthrobacter sp. NtRootC45]BCW33905.1 hypothetical protein NtRootD5_42360 [Arthrobacter sp. NtRootD5]